MAIQRFEKRRFGMGSNKMKLIMLRVGNCVSDARALGRSRCRSIGESSGTCRNPPSCGAIAGRPTFADAERPIVWMMWSLRRSPGQESIPEFMSYAKANPGQTQFRILGSWRVQSHVRRLFKAMTGSIPPVGTDRSFRRTSPVMFERDDLDNRAHRLHRDIGHSALLPETPVMTILCPATKCAIGSGWVCREVRQRKSSTCSTRR